MKSDVFIRAVRIICHHSCHLLTIFATLTSEIAALLPSFHPCGFALPHPLAQPLGLLCAAEACSSIYRGAFWPGRVNTHHDIITPESWTCDRGFWLHTLLDTCAADWGDASSSVALCSWQCCKGNVSVPLWGLMSQGKETHVLWLSLLCSFNQAELWNDWILCSPAGSAAMKG